MKYYVIFHRHGSDENWDLSFDILIKNNHYNRLFMETINHKFRIQLYGRGCQIAEKYAKANKLLFIGSEDFQHNNSTNIRLMKDIKELVPLKRRIFLLNKKQLEVLLK